MYTHAVFGALVAFGLAVLLTPVAARIARAVGAIEQPKARNLGDVATPLLGGLAIFVAVVVAALLTVETSAVTDSRFNGILVGATVITIIGAIDDRLDLHPAVKLIGQIVAAVIPVYAGVEVTNITLPQPIGPQDLGSFGAPLTVLGLVGMMNVVNFSDGTDGLAAGVCMIAAAAFCIIAFDLGRDYAAVFSACVAGAAGGFLVYNFPPASIYMGDAGANLLGFLLGCVAVEGAVKTQALLALVFPLVVLAVPFLDTTFVVLKRLKYGQPVYRADANHFHHRFNRIGFSSRRTLAYLYVWTTMLAAYAVSLRFIPYSDSAGNFNTGWLILVLALGVVVLAASVYLVYVLEILKLKRLSARRLRRQKGVVTEQEVVADVERQLETGEFEALDL
jgi:UDP-GlcNAc:undecaprenyl-phosphate GlcNAc-1-phosphate transferase